MTNPKLYFCVAMPRSGKSTFCNEWAKGEVNRVIVSSDDIRKALHGKRYETLAETMVFAIKHVMIRALLDRGFTVMVDGTHTSRISIQRILEIDRNAVGILFDTPKETCILRAINTNQTDVIPAIHRTADNLKKIQEAGGLAAYMCEILEEIDERNANANNVHNQTSN
jgi:predicted kinase